jgi:hypothetical protein
MTTAIAMAGLLAAAGCGGHEGSASTTAPSVLSDTSQTSSGGGGGGCGTAKETLTGAAISGVTPSGEAVADMSKFCSGGATSLTVNVRNVKLADGVALQVTIDFKPIGTITLAGGSGRVTTSLGHFAVSFDQVRVKNGDTTILQGGSFR